MVDTDDLLELWEENLDALRAQTRRLAGQYGVRYLTEDILSETYLALGQSASTPLDPSEFLRFAREVARRQALRAMQREAGEIRVNGEVVLRRRTNIELITRRLNNELALSDADLERFIARGEGLVEWHARPDAVRADEAGGRLARLLNTFVAAGENARPGGPAWRLAHLSEQLLFAAHNLNVMPSVTEIWQEMCEALDQPVSYNTVYSDMRTVRDTARPGVGRVRGGTGKWRKLMPPNGPPGTA